MTPNQIVQLLSPVAGLLLPIFVGTTWARRTKTADGEVIYLPSSTDPARRTPLGIRQLCFHLWGCWPTGRLERLWEETRISIYPLFDGLYCYLVSADVDDKHGRVSIRELIAQLGPILATGLRYEIHVYLEVSASGRGLHLWVFFSEPVRAAKARRLLHRILVAAGLEDFVLEGASHAAKGASFDKYYPAQDSLAPDQVGNCIALPFNGEAQGSAREGRSIILDTSVDMLHLPEGPLPCIPAEAFAARVRRHTAGELDAALERLARDGFAQEPPQGQRPSHGATSRRPRASGGRRGTTSWPRTLTALGIPYSRTTETVATLETCPCCGATRKAWVNLSTGFLNCWRASCSANDGVPPQIWLKKTALDQEVP